MKRLFREKVIMNLLNDHVKFLTLAGLFGVLMAIAILVDRTKDMMLVLSMVANIAFGMQLTKVSEKIKE